MLVLTIAEDFYKLFYNGSLTAVASLCKFGRVMIVTVDISFVLVVAVLGAKDGGTDRTGEVLNVVFPLEGGDV